MDQVVPQRHLVLLLSFVKVSIQHLQNSVLGVNLSVMVLLVDLDLFFELLSFG
jgi:hypothetical protein